MFTVKRGRYNVKGCKSKNRKTVLIDTSNLSKN